MKTKNSKNGLEKLNVKNMRKLACRKKNKLSLQNRKSIQNKIEKFVKIESR